MLNAYHQCSVAKIASWLFYLRVRSGSSDPTFCMMSPNGTSLTVEVAASDRLLSKGKLPGGRQASDLSAWRRYASEE
jgi:hypothetical protein